MACAAAVCVPGGAGAVDVVYETGDVVQSNVSYPLPAILAGSFIELFLQVDPLALTAQPAYAIDNGPMTDLGPTITKIIETATADCGARFADPNYDGVPELIVADTTYKYQFCSGAESPLVEVIMAYDRFGRTYRPQSALYPGYYRAQAEAYLAQTDLSAQIVALSEGGQIESVKCRVLGLVLPYLYGGMRSEAWSAFNQYYRYPDAASFRSQIETLFNNSPFCK